MVALAALWYQCHVSSAALTGACMCSAGVNSVLQVDYLPGILLKEHFRGLLRRCHDIPVFQEDVGIGTSELSSGRACGSYHVTIP